MRASGFRVEVRDLGDVTPIRRRYGVPDALASCHTALVAGYAIEGHVPAADVKRLLRERPKLKGLAVPGMTLQGFRGACAMRRLMKLATMGIATSTPSASAASRA